VEGLSALPTAGSERRGATRPGPPMASPRQRLNTQPSASAVKLGMWMRNGPNGLGAAAGRNNAWRRRPRPERRQPAASGRTAFLILLGVRTLTVQGAQRAQSADSRKNARITSAPWDPDSVGGRIIYRRPWFARRNDCLLLTPIISMSLSEYSLSAYSVGSTVVSGFCLQLQLRARGCSRMSVVIRLSGGQRGPQGARH
jgi:hypothetical protein